MNKIEYKNVPAKVYPHRSLNKTVFEVTFACFEVHEKCLVNAFTLLKEIQSIRLRFFFPKIQIAQESKDLPR